MDLRITPWTPRVIFIYNNNVENLKTPNASDASMLQIKIQNLWLFRKMVSDLQ